MCIQGLTCDHFDHILCFQEIGRNALELPYTSPGQRIREDVGECLQAPKFRTHKMASIADLLGVIGVIEQDFSAHRVSILLVLIFCA